MGAEPRSPEESIMLAHRFLKCDTKSMLSCAEHFLTSSNSNPQNSKVHEKNN